MNNLNIQRGDPYLEFFKLVLKNPIIIIDNLICQTKFLVFEFYFTLRCPSALPAINR